MTLDLKYFNLTVFVASVRVCGTSKLRDGGACVWHRNARVALLTIYIRNVMECEWVIHEEIRGQN